MHGDWRAQSSLRARNGKEDSHARGYRGIVATQDVLTITPCSPMKESMPSADNSGRAQRPGMRATSYLVLAAQLLSLVHMLVVRHSMCPEDGDVIHTAEPHETLSARAFDEASSSSSPSAGAAPQAEHGHDHCLTCASTSERFALVPPTQTSAAAIELATPLAPPADAGLVVPVAVIVLAPKNSPPAA